MPGAAKKAAKMAAQRPTTETPEPPATEAPSVESETPVAVPDVDEAERLEELRDADAVVKLDDDLETPADDELSAEADEPTAHPSVVPPALQTYAPVVGSDGPRSQSELDALG